MYWKQNSRTIILISEVEVMLIMIIYINGNKSYYGMTYSQTMYTQQKIHALPQTPVKTAPVI